MDIASVIKQRRAELRIKQEDLAEMAEVSLATIKDIERRKGNPALSTIERITDVLGMEVSLQIRKIVP